MTDDINSISKLNREIPSIWIGDSSPLYSSKDLWLLSKSIWLFDRIYFSSNVIRNVPEILTSIKSLTDIEIFEVTYDVIIKKGVNYR